MTEEPFDSVSEEEVMELWRRVPHVLSEDETWHAIVVGIALDAAFRKYFEEVRDA